MNRLEKNLAFVDALREIDRVSSEIAQRGFDDAEQDFDDYTDLLRSFEFRRLVTLELYEAYFKPRRHEFELHILTQLVDAIVSSRSAAFILDAAATAIVGGVVYDGLKHGLAHIAERFGHARRTKDSVCEIAENVEKIGAYMDTHDNVTTTQVSGDLDIEIEKVAPILKLLGCRSHRVKKRKVWIRPSGI